MEVSNVGRILGEIEVLKCDLANMRINYEI